MKKSVLHFIDYFLAEKIARKIKLLRMILLSDCHFENYIHVFPDKITDEELISLKENLDQNSIKVIERFLQLQSYSCLLNSLKDNPFLVINCNNITCDNPDELANFKALARIIAAKYPFIANKIKECALIHGLPMLSSNALNYIKNKDFIDAGAFEGESNLLLQQYEPYRVYSFEPSIYASNRFIRTLTKGKISQNKYKLEHFALGDENKTIQFDDHGTPSSQCGSGNSQVDMITLDSYRKKHHLNIGFIKADVEGYGVNMLKGMVETISEFRPILSLSIYHNKDEFLNTKRLIEQMNLNYSIKIVFLNPEIATREVCLLAVPAELSPWQ